MKNRKTTRSGIIGVTIVTGRLLAERCENPQKFLKKEEYLNSQVYKAIEKKSLITFLKLWIRNKKIVQFFCEEIRSKYYLIQKNICRMEMKHKTCVLGRVWDRESGVIHMISTKIAQRAVELREQRYDPKIVFRDFKEIRTKHKEREKICRKLNNMQNVSITYRIIHMLSYKELWSGMYVFMKLTNCEHHRNSHRCCSRYLEKKYIVLKSSICEVVHNIDLNRVANIGARLFRYILINTESNKRTIILPENSASRKSMVEIEKPRSLKGGSSLC